MLDFIQSIHPALKIIIAYFTIGFSAAYSMIYVKNKDWQVDSAEWFVFVLFLWPLPAGQYICELLDKAIKNANPK